MIIDQNHGEISWGNIPGQFYKSPVFESLLKAIHSPLEEIQLDLKKILEQRSIDSATGRQLDGIGQILRQPRRVNFPFEVDYFGFDGQRNIGGFSKYKIKRTSSRYYDERLIELPDDEYRKILYWRIAMLTSNGTSPEIHQALDFILDIDKIRINNQRNANLSIFITIKKDGRPSLLSRIKELTPISAGIGANFILGKKQTFGFYHQDFFGFGKGSVAKNI